jgi:hypothetical protein
VIHLTCCGAWSTAHWLISFGTHLHGGSLGTLDSACTLVEVRPLVVCMWHDPSLALLLMLAEDGVVACCASAGVGTLPHDSYAVVVFNELFSTNLFGCLLFFLVTMVVSLTTVVVDGMFSTFSHGRARHENVKGICSRRDEVAMIHCQRNVGVDHHDIIGVKAAALQMTHCMVDSTRRQNVSRQYIGRRQCLVGSDGRLGNGVDSSCQHGGGVINLESIYAERERESV